MPNHREIPPSAFSLLFTGICFAPLMEELLLRSIIILNSRTVKLLFSTIIALIIYFLLKPLGDITPKLAAISSVIVCYIVLTKIDISSYIPDNTRKRTIILLIITSLIFGFLHMRFDNLFLDIATVSFIASKVIMGMAFGYIRIKNGLSWSILMHSAFNATISIPIALSIY